jgi:arylsulfatase A-like enzyme
VKRSLRLRGIRLILGTTVAVLAAAIVLALYRSTQRAAPRHNVLLITLDTTRADHLGCYGAPDHVSPRIDGAAAAGVLFENAYAVAAVTPVSHASILTGEYPYTHGLRVMHGLSGNRLPESAVTLAEILKDAGYQTAAFVSAFPAGSRFGLQQGFDTFDEAFLQQPVDQIVDSAGTVNTANNQRRADATTDLALKWLSSVKGNFFVWLHYFDPHDVQLIPPLEFLNQLPPPSGTPAEQLRYVYDTEIRYMDQQIGRVLDGLEAAGRLQDTVVVIVADHGQGLGDHHWWTHGILYQEQIRVPLIVRAPGVPPGRRVQHLVRTIDIAPTILELVGLDARRHASMDGASLVPMLRGEAADPGYVAYADSLTMLTYGTEAGTLDRKNDMLFTVSDGHWKYILHMLRENESELYDLTHDAHELTNLYAERPAEVERLRQNLRARPFQPKRSQGQGHLSDEDLERLRSLGYLE